MPDDHTPRGDMYFQRRVDALVDQRIGALEREVDAVRNEVSDLAKNVYRLLGALGVVVVVAQLGAPLLAKLLGLPM